MVIIATLGSVSHNYLRPKRDTAKGIFTER